jgi:hypothetical protein
VSDGADQERDECRHGSSDVGSRSAVDMSAKEVVNWDIPFAGELKPIGTVPPVRVEVPVCEALNMSAGNYKSVFAPYRLFLQKLQERIRK